MSQRFQITLMPAERTLDAEPGESILSAALRQGVNLPHGCRDGVCGSCKSQLLSGHVVHGEHAARALSAAEAQAGKILPCVARPQSDCTLDVQELPPMPLHRVVKTPVRVQQMERVAADVVVLTVQLPATLEFGFAAGQYVEFTLRDGARRCYSIANSPQRLGDPRRIELHVRHMPGGKFTDHAFGAMKAGDILRMEGPHGSFQLHPDDTGPIVMLASGTGFAPIKALLEQLEDNADQRPVNLYWGGRRAADLYRRDWCEAALYRHPRLRFIPVLSEPGDNWTGRTGFVHDAVMADLPDLSAYRVYACGAPLMVDAARRDFTAHCRLAPQNFHADSFVSEADKAREAAMAPTAPALV